MDNIVNEVQGLEIFGSGPFSLLITGTFAPRTSCPVWVATRHQQIERPQYFDIKFSCASDARKTNASTHPGPISASIQYRPNAAPQ
jgi:hypothetical protein